MALDLQHEPVELDELLAFVGGVGLGEGVNAMKPQASSPNEPLEMSDEAWFNDLEQLFNEEPSSPLKRVKPNRVVHSVQEKANEGVKTLPLAVLKPAKKESGRPRVSRKEELDYLRVKVKEMEVKLRGLKETSKGDQSLSVQASTSREISQDSHAEHSIALWKSLAGRQRSQRELVEVENARLREKLKSQVRMAKSLKRILCKRTRDEEQGLTIPKRSRLGVNSAAGLFDDMLQCLDDLYEETDMRIARSPTASMANPVIRKRDVKYSDIAGMFLEFQDSKFWPFDMHTVSQAQWRFLTEPGHKFNKYIDEQVEMRDDTMLRKFGVEIKHGNSAVTLFGRQVTRRYVESDRILLVRHSILDNIHMDGAPTGGLTFRESGWIVVTNATDVPGTGSAALVHSYSTMTPDIDLDAQWEIGALTDFVLQSREDVEAGNDAIIENLMIEEATKQTAT
ncbi:hypothetical protein PR002_g3726 [Phytophthora rubi]|uniref:START domain-containing protein n=1 Tax=Phytophthora rubi TaxID=129364 RepID=A0A6A3NNG8_9STRA|nr:hypothetical protein PR002_g3726 [Phytophthora rubi]